MKMKKEIFQMIIAPSILGITVFSVITKDEASVITSFFESVVSVVLTPEKTEERSLEKKLETILKKIEGVSDVSVLITYSESSSVIAIYNDV